MGAITATLLTDICWKIFGSTDDCTQPCVADIRADTLVRAPRSYFRLSMLQPLDAVFWDRLACFRITIVCGCLVTGHQSHQHGHDGSVCLRSQLQVIFVSSYPFCVAPVLSVCCTKCLNTPFAEAIHLLTRQVVVGLARSNNIFVP